MSLVLINSFFINLLLNDCALAITWNLLSDETITEASDGCFRFSLDKKPHIHIPSLNSIKTLVKMDRTKNVFKYRSNINLSLKAMVF